MWNSDHGTAYTDDGELRTWHYIYDDGELRTWHKIYLENGAGANVARLERGEAGGEPPACVELERAPPMVVRLALCLHPACVHLPEGEAVSVGVVAFQVISQSSGRVRVYV